MLGPHQMFIPYSMATSLVDLSQQGPEVQTCGGTRGPLSQSPATTHLGRLLVLKVAERWLDVISSVHSAVLHSLRLWRTSAVLPARLHFSALSFLISTPCWRLAARFPCCLPALGVWAPHTTFPAGLRSRRALPE